MRIVLLGPPGSGKAELAEKIAEAYQLPIVTQCSVVDAVAAEPGELGRLAAEARDASRVSDELLMALLRIQLPKMDLSRGYLLVDMPRDSAQADVLDAMLDELARPVDLVIKLDVDMDELMERLVGRICCDSCGACYNMYINPPLVDGVCDECGARVRRRPDDYEETISNRLRVYEGQMGPLLQYYAQAEKLHRFDATGEIEPLWKKVKALIDATPSPEALPAPTEPEPASESGEVEQQAPVTKKATTKKATTKKAASKKATTKKAATKKAASKKAASKKAATKKAASKKAATKKAVTKKAATKKAATKKAATKKAATKKAATKKAASKKAASKKAASKKAASKKAVAKKAPRKKVTAKKTAAKKVTRKSVAKKVAKKKTTKKTAKKKAARRR